MPCQSGYENKPCQNGGTITGTTGNCACSCESTGFIGFNCEESTVCVAGPGNLVCLNGGKPDGKKPNCHCNC
jgi:hypothetical protein